MTAPTDPVAFYQMMLRERRFMSSKPKSRPAPGDYRELEHRMMWWNDIRGTEAVKVALTRAVRSLTLRGHLLSNCSRNAIVTTFLKKMIDIRRNGF